MKDENNQQDNSMQKDDMIKDQSQMPEEQSNEPENMQEPDSGSGFKINRGFIILGLILFVMVLFGIQKYIHFGDSNYKSKKIMAEEQQLPEHNADQPRMLPSSDASNNAQQPATAPAVAPSIMPSTNNVAAGTPSDMPPSGAAIATGDAMNGSGQNQKQIQDMIQKYIQDNPEVIAQALQNMNAKATKAKEMQSKDYVQNNIAQMTSGRPYLGNANGNLVIIEFFDYKCSYCKRAHLTLERVLKDYPDAKLVLEAVPVLGQSSGDAARASLAAWSVSPQNFARFHEDLLNSPNMDLEAIKAIARKDGISSDALVKTMNSPSIQNMVNSNLDIAQNVGMRGVPTFIVDGVLVPGSLSYEAFKDLLDKARNKKMANK